MRAFTGALLVFLTAAVSHAEEKKKPEVPFLLPFRLLKPLAWNLQRGMLKLPDTLNKNEPFEEFTRAPDIRDVRPLIDKAALFEREIEQDFLKDGGRLFWSKSPNNIGDMAIWQGYYTAFRSFQYAVTQSKHSVEYLRKAMEGMALLQAGYDRAYLVRGVDPVGGEADKHDYWHSGHEAGKNYDWVDDASGSSLTGYMFGLYCAYVYGDAQTRLRSKDLIVKVTKNLIQSDYRLLNSDGKPSRYGSHNPKQWILNPQRVLTAIALLELAHMASGDEVFLKEKKKILAMEVVKKIAGRGEVHLLWFSKAYHQHLIFMNFFVLMGTEQDEEWRGVWGHYSKRLMDRYSKEGNSFFNFSYGAYSSLNASMLEKSLQTLHEFSFPKQQQAVRNSKDPALAKAGNWSVQPLPVWKRPNSDVVWQRNPYKLDGNTGDRHTGIDFLIAYWMGRYFGYIKETE